MGFSTYPHSRYVSGTYKRECDNCGFDYLRAELVKQHDKFIVCAKCFDPRPRHEMRRHIKRTTVLKIE